MQFCNETDAEQKKEKVAVLIDRCTVAVCNKHRIL